MSKSVLDLFGSLKGLLKFDKIATDNLTFRLHYKVTVIIFVTCCVMVTAKQYIGEPIHCIVSKDHLPQKFVDTYCWIHSTYTIPKFDVGQKVGKHMLQTGVTAERRGKDIRQHQTYYQWVCFVLFFQSVLFYIPRYLWKNFEGGRVKHLTEKLTKPIMSEEERMDHKNLMIKHVLIFFQRSNPYAYRFVFCEVLNLINVFVQIYIMDVFLGNQFTTYGWRVFKMTFFESEIRDDPLNIVFPKLTKCEFHKYGPSGSIEIIDSLCVLPLNIVNEKVYILIWFWCYTLAIFSSITFMYRLITLCSSVLRGLFLKYEVNNSTNNISLDIDILMRNMSFEDWFLMRLIGKNIDLALFKEFISDLAAHFKDKDNHNISDEKKNDRDMC